MSSYYTVELEGMPDLPAPERIQIEVRYVGELERMLGGRKRLIELLIDSATYEDCLIDGHTPTANELAADGIFEAASKAAEAAVWRDRAKPTGASFFICLWPVVPGRAHAAF
jgi:hypothetical protein